MATEDRVPDLIEALRAGGVQSAAELRSRLALPPTSFSRVVRAAGDRVLRLGRTRATRYGLPRRYPGLQDRVPIHRVDAEGRVRPTGALILLATGHTWVEPLEGTGHLYDGLPPVVHEMAPAGYLGRRFTARHPDLTLPQRLQDWSDDHRLLAVSRRGDDCPGDLILGDESLESFLGEDPGEARAQEFPALAERSGRGGAGSSAAGEQPKFATLVDGEHRLVKFTPGDGSPSDARWRDLLVCEELASATLNAAGIAASRGRCRDVGARRFLVVDRFDRIGVRGRRGVLTLGTIDDELFGQRNSWSQASARLLDASLLSEADDRTIRLLEAFAMLIDNDDRHFGNLAFFADGMSPRPALTLAPVYDMLPMVFAPTPGAGVVPDLQRHTPRQKAALIDVWDEATDLAGSFWESVADDRRISDDFRRFADH